MVGFSKSYKSVSAVDDLSFAVGSGECIGLLGPNGAGKTSLMSCLVGLRLPTSGTVRVLGCDPAGAGQTGHRIAYVFDPPGLSADFTAVDCLRWEALAQGLPPETATSAVEEYGIAGFAKRRVSRMSTGQRQRVAIAASLVGDPDVLILDEPSNGLDVEAARWLRELVRARTRAGRTTIVSSHQLNEVRRVTDRVVVINRTLRFDGQLPDLADDELDDWYLDTIDRKEVLA
ncbi:ABC transporter ATP-binding protein [Cellulomonas sp. PhB143]|uniref:ABC transporter ATP-binding protein n=1 Tax=Cellulomonas sp. PhB143 TaxID=2485186 RepID=UPI000FAD6665|nr:ABC transporter ATP-binding protein [Cellulomonas sp. PhB143]ROS76623.1 ABC-type multidrug transport system ATPase subunit [Cellulomonas sp. PhB143]